MNWETKRFSQIMKVTKGEAITKASEVEGPYPVILGGQEPAYYIDRYNHEGKAIVVSRSGASAGYASFWNEPIFITDGFLIEPLDNNYHEYIYYLLKYFGKAIHDLQNGSAIPHVTPKTLYNLKAPIPPKNVQKQIAEAISAYDNLIENNNKRIKVLEQMAENLYKEWFVRFRFPGHESVLFENDLPYGWRIQRLEEVSDFVYGKMPEKQFVSDTGYPIFSGYQISGYYKEYSFAETMLVLIARGVGGTGEVRMAPAFSYITNLSIIFRLKNPELYKMYLYYLFSLKNLRYLDTGAAQSQITIDNLKRVRVVTPANNVLLAFNKQISKIMELIEKIKEQNALLNKQRDLLLPRLMSGKMEV